MFEAKGRESQWKTIYRNIHNLPVGSMVDMDYLRSLLPGAPESSVRAAFHRAMKEMENVDQRSFVTEWGVGYRVAAPNEHESLAKRQQRFAQRRVDVGLRKAASADRSALTRDEQVRLNALQDHLMRSKSFMKQLDRKRDGVLEDVPEAAKVKVAEEANDGLDKLDKLLESHGIKRELTE